MTCYWAGGVSLLICLDEYSWKMWDWSLALLLVNLAVFPLKKLNSAETWKSSEICKIEILLYQRFVFCLFPITFFKVGTVRLVQLLMSTRIYLHQYYLKTKIAYQTLKKCIAINRQFKKICIVYNYRNSLNLWCLRRANL